MKSWQRCQLFSFNFTSHQNSSFFMKKITLALLSILAVLMDGSLSGQSSEANRIWYDKPAVNWEGEALPIGNGRLGAMFFGGTSLDIIQFNEQSLWSGDNNWDGEYLTGDHGFGSYRNFGEIVVSFSGLGEATEYKRELDLSAGTHKVEFSADNVKYERTAFASYPDQLIVIKYSSSKKHSFNGTIRMNSAQEAISEAAGNSIAFAGEMPNHLKYAAVLKILNDGGTISAEKNTVKFEGCNSLILLLDARTNYKPDYYSDWRGEDPLPKIEEELSKAMKIPFDQLLTRHTGDFAALSSLCRIDIGESEPGVLLIPTDQRLKKYADGGKDPDLEETMFHYGRYLLISSSRPRGLPANLQGLWNNSNTPPWASDYHNNINIQMNYWAAETTNLSECHIPLIDFIDNVRESCRIATQRAFGDTVRGWTARTSQSIFGGNGWEWNITASAWYAHHLFEHWAFTLDTNYLKDRAYPMIKEICEFWVDRLKTLPDGTLVAPDGWSPEHGPREDGVMFDQQLIWDLFRNYLDAADALGADPDFRALIADMQSHLAPNKIGSWGQLQEWQTDRDDPNDQHRHTAHLFAVYPGRQINLVETPDLAEAAVISLRSRSGNFGDNEKKPFTVGSTIGDSRRSWTWPWRCALWARLGEPEKAGMMVRGLLTYNTLPNLFCNHPPFQLDGNFGITAAMAEMLLQSHTGEIVLLPAIPAEWAKKGSFTGLCARGAYVVDCEWKDGKVIKLAVQSNRPGKVKLIVNGRIEEVDTKPFKD
jgi:alpha-L-fucosidase 2